MPAPSAGAPRLLVRALAVACVVILALSVALVLALNSGGPSGEAKQGDKKDKEVGPKVVVGPGPVLK
jgi:hypothetical protein